MPLARLSPDLAYVEYDPTWKFNASTDGSGLQVLPCHINTVLQCNTMPYCNTAYHTAIPYRSARVWECVRLCVCVHARMQILQCVRERVRITFVDQETPEN